MKAFLNKLLLLLAGLLFFASCVSNRQYQYLQKDDVNKNNLPTNKVVRTYALDTFDYKIQPQDVLMIRFKSESPKDFNFLTDETNGLGATNIAALQFTGDLVDENGEVPFPVLGKVKVSGLNIFEIQDKLQLLADKYLDATLVKVRLVNYRITVLGEVNKEGSVAMSNNRVSLLEAIGLAGGFGEIANRSNVKLIRQKGGITEVLYINLLEEDFMSSPYYYVNQNDILIVPPMRQRPFRKYFGQNLALVVSSLTLLLLSYNIINTAN